MSATITTDSVTRANASSGLISRSTTTSSSSALSATAKAGNLKDDASSETLDSGVCNNSECGGMTEVIDSHKADQSYRTPDRLAHVPVKHAETPHLLDWQQLMAANSVCEQLYTLAGYNKIFEADKYVQNTDEAYRKIKLALEKTQSKQKKAADRHRRELVFSLGDWVLLRFEKARLRKMKGKERLFPKLGMRYYGPFQVCDKISDVEYRLKLPEGWKIHNAFHVSLRRPFVGDVPEDIVSEEKPEVEELDEILVPEQILAHKDRKVRGKVARRYLVKFKNYSPMDAKWMEEAELVDSPQLLKMYLEAFQLQPTVT
ncbi:hypothetical protein L7F22_056191 [Adiantum nelumboides]|nr:hypothetical protein [Adiantum nelumboides]